MKKLKALYKKLVDKIFGKRCECEKHMNLKVTDTCPKCQKIHV